VHGRQRGIARGHSRSFAVVSYFEEERLCCKQSAAKDLEQACDTYRESDNLFYRFALTCLRTNPYARYEGVAEVPLVQARKPTGISLQYIEGSVCIWSPGYSRAFSVPVSFHLSEGPRKVVMYWIAALKHFGSGYRRLRIRLAPPGEGTFLKTDLTRDTAAD